MYVAFPSLCNQADLQAWKKKWFVLRTGKIAYYKDDRVSSLIQEDDSS